MPLTRTLDELKLAVNREGFQLKSVKLHGSCADLGDEIYDYVALQKLPTFPTIFFILTEHSEAASKVLSHLAVSLSEINDEDIDTFRLNHQLQRVGDEFEQIITSLSSRLINDPSGLEEETGRLEGVFLTCCGNYPGAVVVRHSYDVFQMIKESDWHDWKYQTMQASSVGGPSSPPSLKPPHHTEESKVHETTNQTEESTAQQSDNYYMVSPTERAAQLSHF
ncbi:hypothetical protein CPB86DRAFT_819455 [Serendipita vermifera]|nr:hypothetical protein CPB86DRAFT_819455 [Serendipita vermifera]